MQGNQPPPPGGYGPPPGGGGGYGGPPGGGGYGGPPGGGGGYGAPPGGGGGYGAPPGPPPGGGGYGGPPGGPPPGGYGGPPPGGFGGPPGYGAPMQPMGYGPAMGPPMGQRSKLLTIILCLAPAMFGFCGVHRFYTGHIGIGIIQLLTFGGCGVWQLIDLIMLFTGKYTDSEGKALQADPSTGGLM